jgi:hypothetical protein
VLGRRQLHLELDMRQPSLVLGLASLLVVLERGLQCGVIDPLGYWDLAELVLRFGALLGVERQFVEFHGGVLGLWGNGGQNG